MIEIIDKTATIDALADYIRNVDRVYSTGLLSDDDCKDAAKSILEDLPSTMIEPLTDNEQRIFLSAMEREMKICKEIDKQYIREAYENSLIYICNEINRKVKGILWRNWQSLDCK